jgi:hypothetical protein
MITTLTDALKGILGLNKPIDEEKVECAIDEDIVECSEMDAPAYTGVPAPVYLENDEWFGTAVVSEKSQDYMIQETEIKQQESENRQYWTKEPEDIHQVMYEMATKSGATTVQLDPIGGSENFQGGSENFHER